MPEYLPIPSGKLREILQGNMKDFVGAASIGEIPARSAHTGVQRFTVVDKSDFSPSGLIVPSDSPYAQEALPVS